MHKEVEQGGADQPAEDHCGDGIQNLLTGFPGGEHKRNQSDTGGQRGHKNGCEAFETCSHNHVLRPAFPFVLHQVQIVVEQQNSVSRCDSGKRNEANYGRDGQHLTGKNQGSDCANEGHG